MLYLTQFSKVLNFKIETNFRSAMNHLIKEKFLGIIHSKIIVGWLSFKTGINVNRKYL